MSKDFFKKNPNIKRALVLGGGGSRGSFEIGVWKALVELGYSPDIVTGISVGALNGALVTQGDLNKAEDMWREIETNHILDYEIPAEIKSFVDYQKNMGNFLFKALANRGISSEPLRNLLEKFLIDENILIKSDIDFGVVVTNYNTKRQESYYVDELAPGQLLEVLLASASLFPAMEKVYINEIPYVDGGYETPVPLELALERNPDEAIVVNILPELNIDFEEKYGDTHILYIEPKWYLGDLLLFSQSRNDLNIKLGYNEIMKLAGNYTGYWYTFDENIGRDYTLFYLALNDLLEGKAVPELFSYISKTSNQVHLLNASSEEWGKSLNDRNLPLALLELAGKIFHVSPGEIYTVEEFQQKFLFVVEQYEQKNSGETIEDLLPNIQFGLDEWRKYLENKVFILSDRRITLYLLSKLEETDEDFSNVKYSLLFQFKPIPLVVALYIYYLRNKNKISYP